MANVGVLHVPKLAFLPGLLECLDETIHLLDRSLGPVKTFHVVRNDPQNDLQLAIGVHALNALDAARAVRVLAEKEMGNAIYPHARLIFDALVKTRWMRQNPARATIYLDSEPFERYLQASPAVKNSPVFTSIVKECTDAVAANPSLLKLKKAVAKNGQPDFRKIAFAMRMPSVPTMVKDIGMTEDDYLVDFGVPSLYPHTAVMHTRGFVRSMNRDGTINLEVGSKPEMLTGYTARALVQTGNIIQEVLRSFPDGAIEFEMEKCVAHMNEAVSRLRGVMVAARAIQ